MDCFSEHAIGHRDADVREAAKELALQASQIIGVRIERYLGAMSERHRRAVMNVATAASEVISQKSTVPRATLGRLPDRDESAGLQFPGNAHYPELLSRRGRGRGRVRSRAE